MPANHAAFFGTNFRQDASNIYIAKSDLPSLTPKENDSAQSLFVALMLKVLSHQNTSSLVSVSIWRAFFDVVNAIPIRFTILVLEVNVPVEYKYIGVEIINLNDNLNLNLL